MRTPSLDSSRDGEITTVSKHYSEQMLAADNFINTVSYPDRATSLRPLLDGKAQLVASSNLPDAELSDLLERR